MALLYPRRQTLFIAIACLIVVGGAAYYSYSGSDAPSKSQEIALTPTADGTDSQSPIDPTNSTDWKKQFSGIVSSSIANNVAVKPAPATKITLTDSFGGDFMARYMQLQQSGLSSNDSVLADTAESLVTSNLANFKPKQYTARDLTISSSADLSAYDAWNRSVLQMLSLYTATKNEAVIAQEYVSSNDASTLKEIDPVISDYKKMISAIQKIPTPSTASAQTLALLNSLSELEFGAESFRIMDTDPMRGMVGIQMFSDGTEQWIQALGDVKTLAESNGLVFVFNPLVIDTVLAYQ